MCPRPAAGPRPCRARDAGSGAEARRARGEESFDRVLTDIQMPGLTGLDVLESLRAAPGPNQAIPVIALTADVTSGGRPRYLDQGLPVVASTARAPPRRPPALPGPGLHRARRQADPAPGPAGRRGPRGQRR